MAEELIIGPVVNLNGTAPEDLLSGYREAYTAIGRALEAVQKTVPHGRDYPTVNPVRYQQAAEQHRNRVERLKRIQFEMEVLYTGVEMAQRRREETNGPARRE